jgi:hypothetical protein
VGLSSSSTIASWSSTATADLNFTSQPFTVVAVASISAVTSPTFAAYLQRFGYVSESSNNGWRFQNRHNSDARPGTTLNCFNNNAVSVYAADFGGSGSVGAGVMHVVVGVNGGGSRTNFVDSVVRGSVATATVASSTGTLEIAPVSGTMVSVAAAVWSRALTAAEVASVYADPFQMFRQ